MISQGSVLKVAGRLLLKARQIAESAGFPWCIQCRIRMKRNGLSRKSAIRWMCIGCGQSVLASTRLHSSRGKTGIYKPDKYEQAARLFREGFSVRRVVALVGISKATASKYRQAALKGLDIRCACGQTTDHRGWCQWRFERSAKRKEFMKRWRQRTSEQKG